LAQNYESLVSDRVRVKNRLKALYRGRGISCEGEAVYQRQQRRRWLGQLTESGVRQRAESLYQQLESLELLVTAARKQLLRESRKQKATKVLRQMPTLDRPDSCDRRHTTSVSHEATVLGLLWFGGSDSFECGLLLR
jgi:hypothetical protein